MKSSEIKLIMHRCTDTSNIMCPPAYIPDVRPSYHKGSPKAKTIVPCESTVWNRFLSLVIERYEVKSYLMWMLLNKSGSLLFHGLGRLFSLSIWFWGLWSRYGQFCKFWVFGLTWADKKSWWQSYSFLLRPAFMFNRNWCPRLCQSWRPNDKHGGNYIHLTLDRDDDILIYLASFELIQLFNMIWGPILRISVSRKAHPRRNQPCMYHPWMR